MTFEGRCAMGAGEQSSGQQPDRRANPEELTDQQVNRDAHAAPGHQQQTDDAFQRARTYNSDAAWYQPQEQDMSGGFDQVWAGLTWGKYLRRPKGKKVAPTVMHSAPTL